jgi:hypothetical protein
MELRRATWTAALRLAVVVSTVAALVTVLLSSVGEVSQTGAVIAVIIVGFALSWVQTGRVRRERSGMNRGSIAHVHRSAI